MKKQLLILNPANYNQSVSKVIVSSSKKANKILYVSLNKTYRALIDILKKEIIKDNFFFIDTISQSLMDKKDNSNVVFMGSLNSVGATGVLMKKIQNIVLDNCIDTIIFDSISSLLVYLEEKESIDWLNSLISFTEQKKINLLFFALKTDVQRAAIKQIEMRVDSTRVI